MTDSRTQTRTRLKALLTPRLKNFNAVDLKHSGIMLNGSGWMSQMLTELDSLMWGRWDYWLTAWATISIPEDPIPPITFETSPHPHVMKMLNHTLDWCLQGRVDKYRGFEWFIQWLGWSLGCFKEKPENLCDDIPSDIIAYQLFNLDLMMLYPYDYFGHWLSEIGHGKQGSAFYPTPFGVTQLMTDLITQDAETSLDKTSQVNDPAVGTGRTLLNASNFSLRLSGQDIDPLVLSCLHVNFKMYAPWGANPLPESLYLTADKSTV